MYSFKKYRARVGLSQKEVGAALGITGQAYSNYETGRREADYRTLKGLSALFGTTIDELLAEPDAPALSDEMAEVLEYYRTKPGIKLLFSLARDVSTEELMETASIIEEFRRKSGAGA